MDFENAEFILLSHTLGSSNPYLSQLEEALETEGVRSSRRSLALLGRRRPMAWHMHWPESVANRRSLPAALRGCVVLAAGLAVARLRTVPIVWTVHNSRSHDLAHPRLDRLIRWLLTRSITGWIALSPSGVVESVEAMPALKRRAHRVIPHGHYRDVYPGSPSKADAREALGLGQDTTVFLFFGLIRPYKNVPALLRTFRSVPLPEARLVVAGRMVEGDEAELDRLAAADGRVMLRLGHVSDDVPRLLAATDVVVLPFKQISNSGSAILALSFNRPVVVPHMGAMPWLQSEVGDRWVILYDELTTDCLLAAAERSREAEGSAPLETLAWPSIGQQTAEFYRSLSP